ncbi:hypothetical protein JYT44_01475 [Caldithrix abyssi]|nr:hypothetical protein [Caldithrix abyssi]
MIGLATCSHIPNLTEDDQLLLNALKSRGQNTQPFLWNDDESWKAYHCIVIRSCWDYHQRLSEFLDWLEKVESAGVKVINSPRIIRWNSNKRYLFDLQKQGIPIVPTIELKPGMNLETELNTLKWEKAVVKPTVSASAYHTWLTNSENPDGDQLRLDDTFQKVDGMIAQQFLPEIKTHGEWSLLFFCGQFSHGVIKKPQAEDFRVQDEYGGKSKKENPNPSIVNQARIILDCIEEVPVYARVDGIEINNNFILMELELIEPYLYLSMESSAAKQVAGGITSQLK